MSKMKYMNEEAISYWYFLIALYIIDTLIQRQRLNYITTTGKGGKRGREKDTMAVVEAFNR
jgi:hypothetical protein